MSYLWISFIPGPGFTKDGDNSGLTFYKCRGITVAFSSSLVPDAVRSCLSLRSLAPSSWICVKWLFRLEREEYYDIRPTQPRTVACLLFWVNCFTRRVLCSFGHKTTPVHPSHTVDLAYSTSMTKICRTNPIASFDIVGTACPLVIMKLILIMLCCIFSPKVRGLMCFNMSRKRRVINSSILIRWCDSVTLKYSQVLWIDFLGCCF